MAIKVNKSDESTVGSGGTKYTGLLLMRPLILNPSKAALEKLGVNLKDEPEYVKVEEENGKKIYKVRLTWYLHKKIGEGESAHNLVANHSVFVESRPAISSTKKVQLIDKFGRSCYVERKDWEEKNIYDWMDVSSAKPAYVGQVDLIHFMRTFAGSEKHDETVFSDFCVNGDIRTFFKPDGSGLAELKKDTQTISKMGNVVKVLLGVRYNDEGVAIQDVFSSFIGRPFSSAKFFHKELLNWKKSGSESFKNRYYGPIDFSRDTPNENDYQLRVFEEDNHKPSTQGASKPNDPNDAVPSNNDDLDLENVGSAPGDAFDPFA